MKKYIEKCLSNFKFNVKNYLLMLLLLKPATITARASLSIPHETDDFKNLIINNNLYVDKTLLIEKYLQLSALNDPTQLILQRPEGWGKTTNMKMLRTFLEIEVDNQGVPLSKQYTINDKIFAGNSSRLKISASNESLQHLGKHPVIFLQLKNATENNYQRIVQRIKACIMETFRVHKYLLQSTKVTDKEKLKSYLSGEFNNDDELITSLYFLSEKLYQHFNTKVHVLIDDYDIPYISSSINNYTNDCHDIEKLIDNIYQTTLTHNPFTSTAFLIGVYPVDVVMNDTSLHYTSDSPLLEFYGFAHHEVESLLERYGFQVDINEMQNWYGGYYIVQGKNNYYNARSVIRCLTRNGTFDYYASTITTDTCEMVESSEYDYSIDDMIDYCNQSDNIFDTLSQRILFRTNNDIRYLVTFKLIAGRTPCSIMQPLENTLEDDTSLDEYLIERSTLFYYGYLTKYRTPSTDEQYDEISMSSMESQLNRTQASIGQKLDPQHYQFLIPNNEAAYFFEIKTLSWIYYMFEISSDEFNSWIDLLLKAKSREFLTRLNSYLSKPKVLKYIRSNDNDEAAKMELYNAIMISLKRVMSPSHQVHVKYRNYDVNNNDLIAHCGIAIYGYEIIFVPKLGKSLAEVVISYKVLNKLEEELYFDLDTEERAEYLLLLGESGVEKITQTGYSQNITSKMNPQVETHVEISMVFCGSDVGAQVTQQSLAEFYRGEHAFVRRNEASVI